MGAGRYSNLRNFSRGGTSSAGGFVNADGAVSRSGARLAFQRECSVFLGAFASSFLPDGFFITLV